MASWEIPGVQHRASTVEEVLDVLDGQPASHLLLNLRAHLAALGITRIADILKWEALVHLALQGSAVIAKDTDQYAPERRPDTRSVRQPSHVNQCATLAAPQFHTAAREPHQAADFTTEWGGGLSDDDFQAAPSICAPVQPAKPFSKAGCLQKRPQPTDSHSTRHVPLAKRMREISNTLKEQEQYSSASKVLKSVKAAASVPRKPAVPLQSAARFNTHANPPPTARSHGTGATRAPNGSASALGAARAKQPAAVPRVGSSTARPAAQAQPGNPASLSTTATLNTQASEPTNESTTPFLSAMNPTPFQQRGNNNTTQQTEAPSPIPPALLQRWLAYRPPPGHYTGLQLSQCVPGCKFLVDSFSKVAQKSGTRSFFLTHFHYDHYMGLSKKFSAGTIYCTSETARLVQLKIKVPATRIKTAGIGEPFQVSGCTVTFLPANHCPGAVMVIFERPHHAPVLHCGDCRYHAEIFQGRPELQALKNRAILHLDTTYCSREHRFPLQAEVVTEVVRLVRAAIQKKKDAGQRPPLLVFGSYTIGKERVYMEVALALNMKVYVEQDKWNVLRCLDMRVRERQLITRNMNEAGIHVVPMRRIRFDKLKELLSHHGGFGAVISFKPTGWTFKGDVSAPASTPSHLPASSTGHHTTATISTPNVPLVATHHPHGTATLQHVLNMHGGGAEQDRGGEVSRQMHANHTSPLQPAQHMSIACNGHMEELADADELDGEASHHEEALDEEDEALFALDTCGGKENAAAAVNLSETADGGSGAANVHHDELDISHFDCGDAHLMEGCMHEPTDSEEASDADEAGNLQHTAAPEDRDASEHVIDLCFSQCSPRPALQLTAPLATTAQTCGARGKPPAPPQRSTYTTAIAADAVAPQAGVSTNGSSRVRTTHGNAAATAAAPNALSILMQSARCTAQESHARNAAATAPKVPSNALSVMMQSARRNAQQQHASGGAGKGRVNKSGRGNGGQRAGVRSTGVDPDACAPWVSVKSSGPVHVLEVPYSEHSSFDELRNFVGWLQPVAVVPTVGGSASATPAMLRVLGEAAVGR